MGRSNENAGHLELPEKLGCRPEDLFKDYSSLQPLLGSCFQTLRSTEEADDDNDFCPLRQANAELMAEQSSLLLKNSELLSQTLLLKLENQRLKQQLEMQQKKHLGASSLSSSSLEESSIDSDNDEEVRLASTSDEDVYTTYDSS
ncbi:hypothetical protein GOP47_0016359 [Adiantum capillus-veneris]|uniref:Uncharacterized protein n=1 Tax=Adiantum capillus-veneris TaxID=13818 RepID=A0A9D4UHI5_ADICA|nr:hypothetical protein GOP47_0016359 [Adiantum capillus-veneris]